VRSEQRVLDEKFDGNERRFQTFVRTDEECRRTVLQSAGLDVGDAAIVPFKARYYGAPDFACAVSGGRLAVVELCFTLHARHAAKDLLYLVDPGSWNVAGLVWVCDSVSTSVLAMIRHYAAKFGLDKRVSLEVLVPQVGRFDGPPPLRFAFDPQLRDLRAGSPRNARDGATVFRGLTELYRTSDEIDTPALARLFGVSDTWVTQHASKPTKKHAARLASKLGPNGTQLRGADGRFLFDLEHVSEYVLDLEHLVTQQEAPHLVGATLTLVSARDPRIGPEWMTLEAFRRETPTRQYAAIKRQLGTPVAFCISSSGLGYSLLWPAERRGALRLHAA